jgi:hypothetical protein
MIRKERQLGNFQSPLSGRIAGPMTGGEDREEETPFRLSALGWRLWQIEPAAIGRGQLRQRQSDAL